MLREILRRVIYVQCKFLKKYCTNELWERNNRLNLYTVASVIGTSTLSFTYLNSTFVRTQKQYKLNFYINTMSHNKKEMTLLDNTPCKIQYVHCFKLNIETAN